MTTLPTTRGRSSDGQSGALSKHRPRVRVPSSASLNDTGRPEGRLTYLVVVNDDGLFYCTKEILKDLWREARALETAP